MIFDLCFLTAELMNFYPLTSSLYSPDSCHSNSKSFTLLCMFWEEKTLELHLFFLSDSCEVQ